MKHIKGRARSRFFQVVAETQSSQAAFMVLKPGESTGEPENEHPRSEQWLFVISGNCRALVNGRRVSLARNSLLLIQKGEVHQIENTGRTPLVTVNFYAPPAYTKGWELRDKD